VKTGNRRLARRLTVQARPILAERNLKGTLMTMTRLLTATAFVALLAGPAAAQSTTPPSSGQTTDIEGSTPATNDTTTTQPTGTTPPTAPGDRVSPDSSAVSSMPGQTSQTGSMNSGSTNSGSTNSGSMGAEGSMSAGAVDSNPGRPLGPVNTASLAGTPTVTGGTLIVPPGLVVSRSASGTVVISNPPVPNPEDGGPRPPRRR